MVNSRRLKFNIADVIGGKVDKKFLQKVGERTLEFIGYNREIEIELAFVGEREMRNLNKKWRRKDKPTDVLSFSDIDIPRGHLAKNLGLFKNKNHQRKKTALKPNKLILMQIVICLPYAKKQAKKLKLTLKQELAMLLSHGILHILGYDHERSKKEADIMEEMQEIMMEKFE